MPILTILRGPQGTGKSTHALELEKQGYIRVNMDSIRAANTERTEQDVRRKAQQLMEVAKWGGKNIVHDNVNLRSVDRLTHWAHTNGYDVEVKTFGSDIPYTVAIERDYARGLMGGHTVGHSVIIQSYVDFGFFRLDQYIGNKAIIVDLDGTLCNIDHRRHHVRGEGKKDWSSFFAGIPDDTVCDPVRDLVQRYRLNGVLIIYVSGRGNEYRKETEEWLLNNAMGNYFALFMRPFADRRDDVTVKREILHKYIRPYFNPLFAVDDRPSVGRMWREEGIFTFMVGNGEEF